MKAACIFLIFILLYIIVQVSDAVKCASFNGRGNMKLLDGSFFENNVKTAQRKTCDACAVFACNNFNVEKIDFNKNEDDLDKEFEADWIYGMGCPYEFYEKCTAQTKAIEKIKHKGANDLVYFDIFTIYVSGCDNEIDGSECVSNKAKSSGPEILENYENAMMELAVELKRRKQKHDASKNSNGLNGGFKFIGIIAFGWILSAAWYF